MSTAHANHRLPSLHLTSWNIAWKLPQKNSAQSKTATQRHQQLSLLLHCFTAVTLGEKGWLFPPQFRTQNCLQAAGEAWEQPRWSARLTPCPCSWAVHPLFLAVGKQSIQVQTVPRPWLLTINFLIQMLFHLPDIYQEC